MVRIGARHDRSTFPALRGSALLGPCHDNCRLRIDVGRLGHGYIQRRRRLRRRGPGRGRPAFAETRRPVGEGGAAAGEVHGEYGENEPHDWARNENIAAGRFDTRKVVEVWKDSPPHRRNMLDPRMTRFGLAYATSDRDPDVRYWAMVLAK